jgi:hypothetical protein
MESAMRGWWAVIGSAALAGCASAPPRFPVDAVRFHYDPVADRGPISIEPFGPDAGADAPAFSAAVSTQLARVGFTVAPPGTPTPYRASVQLSRVERPLPPRGAPISIGIGGASFGGGRGGGVGIGGGAAFPVGGSRGGRVGYQTELSVRIRRGPDMIWEGDARTLVDASAKGADTGALADRLAGAMFGGFPGESGRTVEVR